MSPDAPYRPLPPPASPVWARAARGLSLLAAVALAQIPFNLVAGLLSFSARARINTLHSGAVEPLLVAASLTQLCIHVAASLVTAYALFATAALPASTRTRALARTALALCAVAFAKPFVAQVVTTMALRAQTSDYRAAAALGLGGFAFDWALALACNIVLATLLVRLCDALDAPRPRAIWGLVAFGLGLRLLAPLGYIMESVGAVRGTSLGLVALLASTALWALQSWGWARALRSVARVVGASRAGA